MAATKEKPRRKSKWDTPSEPVVAGSATEAAHEAARKLNAMLAAKGKLATNTPPPLLPPSPKTTAGPNKDSNFPTSEVFSEEVEINDSPHRLVLSKRTTQLEISKYSGASVTTQGQFVPPSEKQTSGHKTLHLFVQASRREQVNLAVQRIRGIMQGDDPNVTPPLPPGFQTTSQSGMQYVQDKVFVGLDNTPLEFNIKDKLIGPGESYFHHITKETGAKVQLRGIGSGYIEPTSGREAFEPLNVYISHSNYTGLNAAKTLVQNLIQTVLNAYHSFQTQQPAHNNYHSNYQGQNQSAQHASMYMQQPYQQYPQQSPNTPGYPNHNPRYGDPSYPRYPNNAPRFSGHPRFQNDGPRFQNDGPRFQNDGPRFQNDGPRFQNDGPRFQNDGPRFQNDGPRFQNDGPRFQNDGPRFQNDGPRFQNDGPRFQNDGPRFQNDGPRLQNDDPRFRNNGPRFQNNGPRFQNDGHFAHRSGHPDHGGPYHSNHPNHAHGYPQAYSPYQQDGHDHYPSRYHAQQESGPDYYHNHQGQPPPVFYPNQRPEGLQPLMTQQITPPHNYDSKHSISEVEAKEHGDNTSNINQHTKPPSEHSSTASTVERKRRFTEAKPVSVKSDDITDTKTIDQPKRRFIEAEVGKSNVMSEMKAVPDKQRSQSTLDSSNNSSVFAMPVLPPPKIKPTGQKATPGVFKAPTLPVRLTGTSATVITKAPQTAKEEVVKTTGIALLGNYDDSSDED